MVPEEGHYDLLNSKTILHLGTRSDVEFQIGNIERDVRLQQGTFEGTRYVLST